MGMGMGMGTGVDMGGGGGGGGGGGFQPSFDDMPIGGGGGGGGGGGTMGMGGGMSEMPPASSNEPLFPCPDCGRRFRKAALEVRHVVFCAGIVNVL